MFTYKNAPRETLDLSGIFDSKKFTQDIAKISDQYRGQIKTTIWQGKYVYKDWKTGAIKGYGDLQTNIDFEFQGSKYRVAVDAKTGKMLNFFRIEQNPKFGPMQFSEIVLKWKGTVTDVEVHRAPNSTITVETSATWKGLLKQGCKSGAITGGLVAAFLGGVSGFKQEGIVGALKGIAIGGIIGAGIGGGIGGAVTLLSRIWPAVGEVAKIGGFVFTVASILLDSTETALDPQEWASSKTDDDGNVWMYRNIHKEGSVFFPDYVPHGVTVICKEGPILEFGEERGDASAYPSRANPLLFYAPTTQLKWQMLRTPEGSSMWWWQDQATHVEFSVTYAGDEAMHESLSRAKAEDAYRFVTTRN